VGGLVDPSGGMIDQLSGRVGRAWPFLGRARELGQFSRVLADPNCRGFLVSGPAGFGKTTFAAQCVHRASDAGFLILRATPTIASTTIPLGAVAHLLPALRGPTAAQDRSDLLRRSAQALVRRGNGRRILLVVDDAHLLDDLSATLVHHLLATGGAFALLTVRHDEPSPDPLLALWKDGFIERLELAGLGDETMGEIAEEVLGGKLDPAARATLVERCRGNLLYLRELLLEAVDGGALWQDESGVWALTAELQPSAMLVRLIQARVERLTHAEREALDLIALGEPLDEDTMEELLTPGVAQSVEHAGFISAHTCERGVEVRMAHPIYGDVIRATLPTLRARAIARALAGLIESRDSGSAEDLLRIGRWRLLGGGGSAPELLRAALAARWRCDFPFAERLVREAVNLGAGFDARLLGAQLASMQGRWGEAETLFAKLESETTSDRDRARTAIARMDNLLYADRAGPSSEIAIAALERITDPAWRDELLGRRTALLVNLEGPTGTLAAARPLLARSTGAAYVWACMTGAWSLARLGRTEEALQSAGRGHAAQLQLEMPIAWYPWFHDFNRCEALLHAGRLMEAEQLAREQHHRGVDERSAEAQGVFALQLAKVLLARGRVHSAAHASHEAALIFRQLGRPMFLRDSSIVAAHAACLAGRSAEARERLSAIDVPESVPAMYDAISREQVRAWIMADDGDIPSAITILVGAADLGQQIGDLAGAIGCLHSVARLGRAQAVTQRLARLAELMEGPLPQARAEHAFAIAAKDGDRLRAVSVRFENLGADQLAVDAAAEGAAVWRRRGHLRRAVSLSRRAQQLSERCEGAHTPGAIQLEVRARLTPAEREAAILAASGRTNKEIAALLVLSVRSVENRLQHVYGKVGVSSRHELAQAIRNEGSD
jgi:DNA-binding CsgD family transcriptional regulator